MSGSECSFWATPTTPAPHDSEESCGRERKDRPGYGLDLTNQACRWPTATAKDADSSRSGDRKDEMGLDQEARKFPIGKNWPTPSQMDASRDGTSLRQMTIDSGKMGNRKGISLHHEVSNWPTPRTPTGGGESAERKKELGRTEAGGGDLQAAVENWPTPNSRDHKGEDLNSRRGGRA